MQHSITLLTIASAFFFSCNALKPRDERRLNQSPGYLIEVSKQDRRTWNTNMPDVGSGIITETTGWNSRHDPGLIVSSRTDITTKGAVARVKVYNDSSVAAITSVKTVTETYNSWLSRQVLNINNRDTLTTINSSFLLKLNDLVISTNPVFSRFSGEAGKNPRTGLMYVKVLQPSALQSAFGIKNSNKLILYNSGKPVGLIKFRNGKNRVYLSPEASKEEKKAFFALSLSMSKRFFKYLAER